MKLYNHALAEQTVPIPSGDSTARSPPVRVGRALRGWVHVNGSAPM
jgi:hypothetical protein